MNAPATRLRRGAPTGKPAMEPKQRTCEECRIAVIGKYRRRRCENCYRRFLRREKGALSRASSPRRAPQRKQLDLFSKVFARTTPGPDGCVIYTGPEKTRGYGRVSLGKRRHASAHRLAYELQVGPIPDGMTIDHLCHNRSTTCPGGRTCIHRRCVNPQHLEAVTSEENTRRAAARPNHMMGGRGQKRGPRKPMDFCSKGHEMTPENTAWEKKLNAYAGRIPRCRQCRRDCQAAYWQRKREAATSP